MPWANYFSLFSLTFHIYKISPTIIPNLLWHYELNDLIHSKELQLFSGMDFTCLHRDFFIDYILDVKLLSYKFMKIALFCFVFNLMLQKSQPFLYYSTFLFYLLGFFSVVTKVSRKNQSTIHYVCKVPNCGF